MPHLQKRNLKSEHNYPTVIVGAGWAGLAAAVSLMEVGKRVILLEAAPQAGGRARSIQFGEHIVDNGQHLLMGAYQETLKLLKKLNVFEKDILERLPFHYYAIDLGNIFNIKKSNFPYLKKTASSIQFQLSSCKKPWNLLNGILNAKQFSFLERIRLLKFGRILLEKNLLPLKQDVSVYDFLIQHQQPSSLIQKLWEPLALAALSTPIQYASAEVFLRVLQDVLTKDPSYSDWLIPKVDLSQILPNPVIKYLNQHPTKSALLTHQRVQQLIIENGRCQGVSTNQETFLAESVILATPPHTTADLLQTLLSETQESKQQVTQPVTIHNTDHTHETLFQMLQQFQYQPITTVYLETKLPIQAPTSMIGFIQGTGHWLFDRRLTNQANLLSIVLSGEGAYQNLTPTELVQSLLRELTPLFPALADIVQQRVITEKRAAFSCTVEINRHRPTNQTPYPNIWLAGDYTQTGYPATLEGAVKSGIEAAKQVLLTL